MTFYLAGAFTGHPNYRQEFACAARRLRKQGHEVLNPSFIPENTTRENAMLICLPMLIQADAVYFLKDWESAEGTKVEFVLALYLHKRIAYESDDCRIVSGHAPEQSGVFHPLRQLSAAMLRRKVRSDRKRKGLDTDIRAIIEKYREVCPEYAEALGKVLYPD